MRIFPSSSNSAMINIANDSGLLIESRPVGSLKYDIVGNNFLITNVGAGGQININLPYTDIKDSTGAAWGASVAATAAALDSFFFELGTGGDGGTVYTYTVTTTNAVNTIVHQSPVLAANQSVLFNITLLAKSSLGFSYIGTLQCAAARGATGNIYLSSGSSVPLTQIQDNFVTNPTVLQIADTVNQKLQFEINSAIARVIDWHIIVTQYIF